MTYSLSHFSHTYIFIPYCNIKIKVRVVTCDSYETECLSSKMTIFGKKRTRTKHKSKNKPKNKKHQKN